MNPDKVPAGERCASTSNRNFVGRQGPGARTHLVSPRWRRRRRSPGMTDFNDRERAEEAKFAHDEEMHFRIGPAATACWAPGRPNDEAFARGNRILCQGRGSGRFRGSRRRGRDPQAAWRSDLAGVDTPKPMFAPRWKPRQVEARRALMGEPVRLMAMPAAEIEALIKRRAARCEVTITDLAGDGDHYAAHVVPPPFAASRALPSTSWSTPRWVGGWAANSMPCN
jgi:hypothetical protein